MNNKIEFNPVALDQLAEGVHSLGSAVKVTLGPKGRNVVINTPYGVPEVTKDGVTVAREVNLEDPIQNLGAQIAKQAAAKTAKIAGDGTTTATVLVDALVTGSLKLIKSGVAPIEIKRKFETLTDKILGLIDLNATPVEEKDILNIASISANNDTIIGKLISSAFNHVGKDGIITMEDSDTGETYVSTVDGFSFDRGLVSPYLATDPIKQEAVYEDALVFVTDRKLKFTQELVPIMEQAARAGKPLVLIADEIENQALALMVMNKLRTGLPIVGIKAPAYGERRGEILRDIAVATNATLISETAGMKIEDTKLEHLGSCKKIVVSKDDTVIIEGAGPKEKVDERISNIKRQLEGAQDGYTTEKLMDRLAKLSGKVAVIYVGAATETELREKKARVDDALRATRSAVAKGFVVGGGTLLAKLADALDQKDLITKVYSDSLKEPMRIIAINAGVSSDVVLDKVLADNIIDNGYNAYTNTYENLVQAGVIDPALVVEEALKFATSAAGMILLSDCVLYSTDKPMMNTDIGDLYGN